MKKLILLSIIILFAFNTNAQNNNIYCFGDSNKAIVGDAGLVDVDGNYVMVGRRIGKGNHYAKFGPNHNLIWSFYTSSGPEVANRVFQTANKDYIGIYSTGFSAYIIRISSSGTVVWNKLIGQITNLYDGFEDSNGDLYFLGGWTSRSILFKVDANGNLVWSKKITTGLDYHPGAALRPTADNNIIICGVTQTLGTTNSEVTVCKITKTGQLLWGYQYGNPTVSLLVNDMEISDFDQSIMIAGSSYSAIGNYNANTIEAVVTKIDSAGNFVNCTSLGETKEDRFTAITQIPNGPNTIFALSGFAKTPAGATKLLLSTVDNNGNIMKYSQHSAKLGNGFFFDQIHYDPTYGLSAMGTGSGFAVANSNEYQFIHFDTTLELSCNLYSGSLTQTSYSLSRTSNMTIANHTLGFSSPTVTANIDSITAHNFCTGDTIHPTPTAVNNYASNKVAIYPNPVLNNLHIEFMDGKANYIRVINLYGEKFFASNNPKSKLEVNTSNWAAGIYFVEIQFQNGKRAMKKIVVQ